MVGIWIAARSPAGCEVVAGTGILIEDGDGVVEKQKLIAREHGLIRLVQTRGIQRNIERTNHRDSVVLLLRRRSGKWTCQLLHQHRSGRREWKRRRTVGIA